MKKRNRSTVIMLVVGLVLAACTRSASTGVVPTATVAGVGGGAEVGEPTDAMNALGTALSLQITQTAQASGGTPGVPTPLPQQVTPVATAPTAVPQATPIVLATPVPVVACTNPYIVKQGDWIYKIARTCGIQPSALIAANPGINANFIRPGQQLNLPAAGATAVPQATRTAACTGTHTVVSGENLFRIAYNCGLRTEQLAAPNGIVFPYTIYPGQVLRFP
jgi:LysM repeat protein